jgi:hypothetical protein
MKLGTKKTKQAELLDALGGDVLASSSAGEYSVPSTPAPVPDSPVQKADGRGSLPAVDAERSAIWFFFIAMTILISYQRSYRHQGTNIFVSTPGWRSTIYGT